MRHTTVTRGGQAPKQAAGQAAIRQDIQRPGLHRTSKSERQPVLYGPELKIIHTPRARSTVVKATQKHISEIIPATKAVQTIQAATATPQSSAKNQPRVATGATGTTPPHPAHQLATLHAATPQKTTAPHRAATPTAHITKHHRPVAVQPITSSRPGSPRQLRKRQPVTISPLSAQPTRPSSPRAQTPYHTAQQTSTQPGTPRSMDFVFVPSEVEPPSAAKRHNTPPPSQLARVLVTEQIEQTQTQATQPVIPISLPTLNLAELAAQPLVAQPSGVPQGEVWWPPAEPELTTTENIPVGTLPRSVLTQQSKKLTAAPRSKRRKLFTSKRRTNKPTTSVAPPPARQPTARHWGRRLSVAGAMVALLAFGGYLTYHNMPAIATRMAATQAGINASFPSYQPSGYSLAGGISQRQGSVLMKFAANAGPGTFTLTQSRSDWDSSAVLANYVLPSFGRNFATTTSRGLTIYSTHNAAAWVNGGILYTIKGNAPLSSEQVERIAVSM
ncbi:MAG: hypothetical protein Q4B27_02345 [Candidatus Saccharibacteria bacterium]|nr:hypothetical protein [Candidatus Saccharibacteria bacterium]